MVTRNLFIAMLVLCTAACSTSKGGLRYVAPPSVDTADIATTSIGAFTDARGEPANWLGAIRGGFGNPLKTIETEKSVSEVVRTVFVDAMRARGLLAATSGQTRIEGTIRLLEGSKFARSESNAEINVRVVNVSDGRTRFERTYATSNVEGSAISMKTGIFASTDELRDLIARTLSQTVDKALDDPDLRDALAP